MQERKAHRSMELGNYALVRKILLQLNNTLETRGRGILQSGTVKISVSQFEELFTRDVSERLKDILALLRTAHSSGEPLSLTEARSLYSGVLQDTLCKILGRLEWRSFCSQPEAIAKKLRGCMLAESALDCVFEALYSWRHVQPTSAADAAKSDVFNR